jgi:putative transposase
MIPYVRPKVPNLRRQTFETAITERCRRRESAVIHQAEDITGALWGTRVSPSKFQI